MRVARTEEMCGDLCELLTDVCLDVGMWPITALGKIYLSHFSPLLSLSFSLSYFSSINVSLEL